MAQQLVAALIAVSVLRIGAAQAAAQASCDQEAGCKWNAQTQGKALLQKGVAVSSSQDAASYSTVRRHEDETHAIDKKRGDELTAIQGKVDEILDKLNEPGKSFWEDSTKHKGIYTAVQTATDSIKQCTQNPSSCNGVTLAKSMTDMASGIMLAASVFVPAGPLVAMMGSFILSFLVPGASSGQAALTFNDVKTAVTEALNAYGVNQDTQATLQAVYNSLQAVLGNIVNAAHDPDPSAFKERYLPSIAATLLSVGQDMQTCYFKMTAFRTSIVNSAMIVRSDCKNACMHFGTDWTNQDCISNRVSDWTTLKNSLITLVRVYSMLPMIMTSIDALYVQEGWSTAGDVDYSNVKTNIMIPMQQGLLLERTMMELRQASGNEKLMVPAENQYLWGVPNEDYWVTNPWDAVWKTTYVEMVRFGCGPLCNTWPFGEGTSAKAWCESHAKGGFEFFGALAGAKYDCLSKVAAFANAKGYEDKSYIKYFNNRWQIDKHSWEEVTKLNHTDYANICDQIDCEGNSKSGICVRKEACAPDEIVAIVQDEPKWTDYGDIQPTWSTVSPSAASSPPCHTATSGDTCWGEVDWAMNSGFPSHPEWYNGLSQTSGFNDFQTWMFNNLPRANCQLPCA